MNLLRLRLQPGSIVFRFRHQDVYLTGLDLSIQKLMKKKRKVMFL